MDSQKAYFDSLMHVRFTQKKIRLDFVCPLFLSLTLIIIILFLFLLLFLL